MLPAGGWCANIILWGARKIGTGNQCRSVCERFLQSAQQRKGDINVVHGVSTPCLRQTVEA